MLVVVSMIWKGESRTYPSSNDGVMHDWLVGLVFEVAIPSGTELWTRPSVHLLEFVLGRTDLDASLDTVGGKRSGPYR
jgi:hypothetical protein